MNPSRLPLLVAAGLTVAALSVERVGVASAQGARAGLVLQFGPGKVREFCVDLGGSERTGEELLQLAGVDVIADVSALGALVCSIDGVGCAFPAEKCLCQCQVLGDKCTYWTYFTVQNGQWTYETRGAASRAVHEGDVDGWSWGPGGEGRGLAPPARTFGEVCRAAGPAEAASPSPAPSQRSATSPPDVSATLPTHEATARAAGNDERVPPSATVPAGTRVRGTAAAEGTGSSLPGADGRTATIAALEAQLAVLGALATTVAVTTPDLEALSRTAVRAATAAETATLAPAALRGAGEPAQTGAAEAGGSAKDGAAPRNGGVGGLATFIVGVASLGLLWWITSRPRARDQRRT